MEWRQSKQDEPQMELSPSPVNHPVQHHALLYHVALRNHDSPGRKHHHTQLAGQCSEEGQPVCHAAGILLEEQQHWPRLLCSCTPLLRHQQPGVQLGAVSCCEPHVLHGGVHMVMQQGSKVAGSDAYGLAGSMAGWCAKDASFSNAPGSNAAVGASSEKVHWLQRNPQNSPRQHIASMQHALHVVGHGVLQPAVPAPWCATSATQQVPVLGCDGGAVVCCPCLCCSPPP